MHIDQIVTVCGDLKFSLEDLVDQGEISPDFISYYRRMLGLNYVRRFRKTNYVFLLNQLLEKISFKSSVDFTKIKYVFVSHTADQIVPFDDMSINSILFKYFCSNAAIIKSTDLNCATLFKHLEIAKLLFESLSDDSKILLVTLDVTFSNILKNIPGSTIMSDGGAAVLLSKKAKYHSCCTVKNITDGRFATGLFGSKSEQILFQQSYVSKIIEVINEVLIHSKVCISKIALILPHNVNTISWRQISEYLGISEKTIYLENIGKSAHAFGLDPFFNWQSAVSDDRINYGDYYLMVSVGIGATFSAALYRY